MLDAYLAQSRLRQLLDLMGRERRLLMTGAFDELESLTARRAAAMDALLEMEPDALMRHADLVRRLGEEAERNRRLMESALKGARAADARLKEIAAGRAQLGVYTQKGERLSTPGAQTARERRF